VVTEHKEWPPLPVLPVRHREMDMQRERQMQCAPRPCKKEKINTQTPNPLHPIPQILNPKPYTTRSVQTCRRRSSVRG
jgi:hypothetical protein